MSAKEQPKRLGRGLAALLGEAASPASVHTPGVRHVPVENLTPGPFQPRQAMTEEALRDLAASITQQGILQPLLVRPHPVQAGQYQIIAGERRWRAAQLAKLHEVPVLVKPLADADALAAGLVENLQREDLNAVEEAEGYRRLVSEFKLSQDKLGEAVGKSRSHIGNIMRILELPPPLLSLVREGKLSAGHAKALLGHPDPVKAAREVLAKGLNVRQTEALTQTANREAAVKAERMRPAADPDITALARSLTARLGVRVDIRFNGKSGQVVLNYSNLDQLDGLLALLNG